MVYKNNPLKQLKGMLNIFENIIENNNLLIAISNLFAC